MNNTSIVQGQWFNEFQFGNAGAALFIIAYIGFYGLGIIIFFGQQLKETQRQRFELPAYFLKTLWDVPNKNKLYEELSDVARLKRIFSGYFSDHESYVTFNKDEIQTMVDERAYACAVKYREKLRRLHLSHTDYYLDSIHRISNDESDVQEQISKSVTLTRTTVMETNMNYSNRKDRNHHILSITVV